MTPRIPERKKRVSRQDAKTAKKNEKQIFHRKGRKGRKVKAKNDITANKSRRVFLVI